MMGRFDTPESDDAWRGDTSWAIPAAKRRRRVGDTGPDRHTFRVMRENFRRECQAAKPPCWLCGSDIDYQARSGTPRAFEADHALPVSTHPGLALDPHNLRPSHSICNRRRQAGEREAMSLTGEPSEDW